MKISCPQCRQPLQMPDNLSGKKVRCPKCQQVFLADAAAADLPMLEQAEPAGEHITDKTPRGAPTRSGAWSEDEPASRPARRPERSQPRRRLPEPEKGMSRGVLIAVAIAGGALGMLFLFALGTIAILVLRPKPEGPAVANRVDKAPPDFAKPFGEPFKREPFELEPVKPDPVKPDPAKIDPIKIDPFKIDPVKVGPIQKPPPPPPIVKKMDPVRPVPPPAPSPELKDTVRLQLKASAIVYDPARGLIYASVGSTVPQIGNSVIAIDPAEGKQLWTVPVGSDPGVMAISENSDALWVGLRGAGSIQKIDLRQRQADAAHSLGKGFLGATFAENIAVLPGTTETVIASLFRQGISPRHDGVAVYDAGVPRPKKTRDHTGSNRIVVAGPNSAFGYNNETTEFGLRRLEIDDSGIHEIKVFQSVVQGFGTDIAFAGKRIYSTNGDVVDSDTGNLVGKLPARGPFAVDAASKRAFYFNNRELQAFDTERLVKVGAARLDPAKLDVGQIILVGDSALALRGTSDIVIVPRKLLP